MTIANNIKSMMEGASWVREMFEKGRQLKEKYGEENVFDFSLGNPILEPPAPFHETLIQLLQEKKSGTHRYMPNAGEPATRDYIAQELTAEMGWKFGSNDVTMCVGAGGGLNVLFKALLNPGDEVVVLAPFFVEYRVYVQNHGGILKVAQTDAAFQIDLEQISQTLTPQTKIVLINSPNNPTGAVYSQESLNGLGKLLASKEQELGHPIYLVSDDPYRHLLFDHLTPCNIFQSHSNSVLITSHSKDLGLAGERIGYIAIHPEIETRLDLQNALAFTTRILGFVNAPALVQRVLPHLKGIRVSAAIYQNLRDIFYKELLDLGFHIVKPQGTFYIFPQSPIPEDVEFVKAALSENILLVPGSGFGRSGYFRIACCCTEETIQRALPHFANLAHQYGLSASR